LDVERFKRLAEKNVDGSLNKAVKSKVEEIREKYLQSSSALEVITPTTGPAFTSILSN
jgi:uncharacterized protein YllA (UPF0747 family)